MIFKYVLKNFRRRKVRTILLSEGLMIDPIGAVLAYLVLQTIGKSQVAPDWQAMVTQILTLVIMGSVLGYTAAAVGRFVHAEAGVAQRIDETAADGLVVFDHEQGFHARTLLGCLPL